MSKPPRKCDGGDQDLFGSRLDQIIGLRHELVKLSHGIEWAFLESCFDAVYNDGPGMPPLPTRLMAVLTTVKHVYDLSGEVVCARHVDSRFDGKFRVHPQFLFRLTTNIFVGRYFFNITCRLIICHWHAGDNAWVGSV